ncbi:phage portal protein [Tenacibaculum sp. SZ-18]|uniref:phage portal protein n=1 Tax=Tenacibaculum sp. SZ-18 TaxID=754423 RepID=UPI0012FDAFD0|nr:phage portal protein [Tenacibaculum sp. SZ-18]
MEKRNTPVKSGGFFNSFFGGITKSGKPINETTALTLSSFYNGLNILSNDYAKLPKSIYRKKDGDRIKLSGHHLNYIVSKRPNQYMTAFSFDKVMLLSAILKGNAYAIINRNELTQKVESLQYVDQNLTPVKVIEHKSKLFYRIKEKSYSSYEIIHVPGFTLNGIVGVGVVTLAAMSLGVNLNSQEYASEYYETKGEGIGIVTTAKPMDPEAKTRYAGALQNRLNTATQHKVAVLDESGSFNYIRLTPQEAQFLQTNKEGVIEVARWLNIPPHKLKSLEGATFSNIEHQEIAHVSDSILPWAKSFKAEYDVKLLTKSEVEKGLYINFNHNSLLQADKKTQAEYFSKLIFSGVYTRNEVRSLLDMNSLEGLSEPLTPVNAQTLEQIDTKLKELKEKTNE